MITQTANCDLPGVNCLPPTVCLTITWANLRLPILFLFALFMANQALAQWKPEIRLTNDSSTSLTSFSNAWDIAASGDTVHVVWSDDRHGNTELYYKRSTNGGLTWEADKRLTNDRGASYSPSIAVSGSVVHFVWADTRNDGQIYYKRSADGGKTWGADTSLTDIRFYSEYPSIATSGSVVHVVWTAENLNYKSDYDNFYRRSADGGLSWEPEIRISNNPAYSGFPSVAACGSMVHIVYEEQRDGNGEIYYKRSTNGGKSWGPETRLTNNPSDSWNPCVAVHESVVHVVWMDKRDGGPSEIYYKVSRDGGKSWGPDTRLTNAPYDSEYPNLAVSGANIHIVWSDDRIITKEIFYKHSTDAGLNWGPDEQLSNATGYPEFSSVAISGSVVHVVWTDYRNRNDEIYYKRNPTGNKRATGTKPVTLK